MVSEIFKEAVAILGAAEALVLFLVLLAVGVVNKEISGTFAALSMLVISSGALLFITGFDI